MIDGIDVDNVWLQFLFNQLLDGVVIIDTFFLIEVSDKGLIQDRTQVVYVSVVYVRGFHLPGNYLLKFFSCGSYHTRKLIHF